ncbi:MAG TPA: hypothetical protein VMR77_02095 [Patescibacteria group bacterium]|nr:hypothetical protein [Patescibacteria group bacterium]
MYKKGNVFEKNEHNNWFYGHFMEGLAKDDRVEIKVNTLVKGYSDTDHYLKVATKLDIIWEGKAIWQLDGEDIPLETGDYLIIPPKVRVRVKVVLSDRLIVQTIKIPSIPDDKVMV